MKRVLAESLSVLCTLAITEFATAILAGTTGLVFWPVFWIVGALAYLFAQAWMLDTLSASRSPLVVPLSQRSFPTEKE